MSSSAEVGEGNNCGLQRGLGKTAGQVVYRPNTAAEALSENGPEYADKVRNEKLIDELHLNGAFEDPAKNLIREKALDKVEAVLYEWVKDISEAKGIDFLKHKYEVCKVVPFGSYCMGVHSSDSDIDVLCIVPLFIDRGDFFADLPGILSKQEGVAKLHSVPDAFVPVIKFECDGVDVDLSMARMPYDALPEDLDICLDDHIKGIKEAKDLTCLNGPRVTLEILHRVPNVENFLTLLRCLKLWARRRGIYSNIVGFPGGVAWAIMGAKVCQLYPNMIPSMLLEKFFFLYKNWNFANAILVAPLEECRAPPGAVYMQAWDPQRLPPNQWRPMSVITPTYPAANSTFNSSQSTLSVIAQEVALAHEISQVFNNGKAQISSLFEPVDFFRLYSNYVQVLVSAPGLEALKGWYGYVESQLRKLVEKLELDEHAGLKVAHPCTRHFGPHAAGPELWQVAFFVGLKFDEELVKQMREQGRSVNLTNPVAEFLQLIDTESYASNDISIQVVKKKKLPQWAKDEYYAGREGPQVGSVTPAGGGGASQKRRLDEVDGVGRSESAQSVDGDGEGSPDVAKRAR
mmetsp:Transcript_9142/g.18241  ORF Transcript_9142/g.18241 Transcript_9142/m.18241 type:complete len:573 (+) Transcript_9142:375-2093(+)|eukprot:CAMPEP_0181324290 /NCGR_PEP_ID=MMETSP1101-20121128/20276_1 /TAXON_ID=46948 /ORGANISM="Rhodomonas abbreviata, Strain Caron Lab Isolate" /LENGTH=572 /DNA_ID=CAMNT_0023432447 /DNA_START=368 /DNA_END=2086 /DNA_ORIENTATION=-